MITWHKPGSQAGQSLPVRDAANPNPKEEKVNQWPQVLLVVGQSQPPALMLKQQQIPPTFKAQGCLFRVRPLQCPLANPWLGFAHGQSSGSQTSWLLPGKAPCASSEQQPNLKPVALQSEAVPSSCELPELATAQTLLWVFFMPTTKRAPGISLAVPPVCKCPSQCSWSHGKCPVLECW